jgi:hypothetical protein
LLKISSHFFSEEFNSSIHHARPRPLNGSHHVPSTGNSLSSPDMIKTVCRTLTPPVSPFHQLRASGTNGERKSPSAIHPPQPGKQIEKNLMF